MKTCTKCKESKELTEFYFRNDGYYYSTCKICACENNRTEKVRLKQRKHSKTIKGKYGEVKSSAVRRAISFNLSKDEFALFWQKPCSYCGSEIATIGIDRVDSSIGYEADNCVSCCTRCNKMKLDIDENIWYDHMKTILTFKGLIS